MERVKALFLNNTLKKWYFKELFYRSGMSRERVNHYLKILTKGKFIARVKPLNKRPYYIARRDSEQFRISSCNVVWPFIQRLYSCDEFPFGEDFKIVIDALSAHS